MSYIFFKSILTELGHKLSYDAVVNYAGNSFCKDSWEMICNANPMSMDENGRATKQQQTIANFLGGARTATKEDLAKMKGHQGKWKK